MVVRSGTAWNLCDFLLHEETMVKVSDGHGSTAADLQLAACHLDSDFTVVWICPEMLRFLEATNVYFGRRFNFVRSNHVVVLWTNAQPVH